MAEWSSEYPTLLLIKSYSKKILRTYLRNNFFKYRSAIVVDHFFPEGRIPWNVSLVYWWIAGYVGLIRWFVRGCHVTSRFPERQPESDRAAVRFPSLDPPPRPTGHSLSAGSQCHTHVTSSYARAIETHAAPPHHFQRMDCHEKVMIISIEILELFARYFWSWSKIKY